MTSCTIIISHFESLPFLKACIRQIKRYAHPDVHQRIVVIDQSSEITYMEVDRLYMDDKDVVVYNTKPGWSGYGIDVILHDGRINTEYICQIHVDAFPIHKNWLYLPIKLIQDENLSFVGQLQFISKPSDSIYPPEPFFAMAQCFNVGRTEIYKEMSEQAGFARFHNREGMSYKNNDWAEWAKTTTNRGWSDDDVTAFHWEDKYRTHNKLSLAITGYIEPPYARIIEDVVFHFGSCREALGIVDRMPVKYWEYAERIKSDYSDELIEEMVEKAKANRIDAGGILGRNLWNGTLKQSSPTSEELNQKINKLKQ
jgi:hypothetical protein